MTTKHFSTEEIIGQSNAQRFIHKYQNDPSTIPPLLIFYGPDGIGKWSLAERFARHILCLEKRSCGLCPSCKAFMNNAHPDYIEFPSDTRIAIGEEKDPAEFTVRWLQSKRLNFRPHLSAFRIILFPDASLINNEAETALLKSLEEPPAHSKFIFLVNDLKKLKQTIISRAVCIPFQYLSQDNLKILGERHSLEIPKYFGGSLNPFEVPTEVLQLTQEKVNECADNSVLLLELESWVRSYKDQHPEWTDNFNYKAFLEIFCLLLIHHYAETTIAQHMQKIEAIYSFKENLHKNIAGIEPFLLSSLFHRLSYLT
ncbi:MAG: hypothetical protein AAF518_00255 [Spirochaetota bacterium]